MRECCGCGYVLGDSDSDRGRAELLAVLGCDGGDEGSGDDGELHGVWLEIKDKRVSLNRNKGEDVR